MTTPSPDDCLAALNGCFGLASTADPISRHVQLQIADEKDASDTTWILSSTFLIFTMQSGFGLLESGSCTAKNEVNIMVKNAADVIFGGFMYWAVGYGLSFGDSPGSNAFVGWGSFFVEADNMTTTGWMYSKFFFQASFATTATTIVSGAMAERTKLEAYLVFSCFNTLVFCFPAHWMWADIGWLRQLQAIDIAGGGPVHLVGGVTGMMATIILRPRLGRFDDDTAPQMGSPTNAILGLFMLWWGWLGFNCGSTFGISGNKWRLAARSAVSTICASMGGGMVGMLSSYIFKKRKFYITIMINGILGALVAITSLCALCRPWIGFVIGLIGGTISCSAGELTERLRIDDPVGVVPVHLAASIWSLLSVGLFADPDDDWDALSISKEHKGIFYGGDGYLLGIQVLSVAAIGGWTLIMSTTFLLVINCTIGLRMSEEHERLGADLVEHNIGDVIYDKNSGAILSHGPGVGECLETLGRSTLMTIGGIESSNFKHHMRRLSAMTNGFNGSARGSIGNSDPEAISELEPANQNIAVAKPSPLTRVARSFGNIFSVQKDASHCNGDVRGPDAQDEEGRRDSTLSRRSTGLYAQAPRWKRGTKTGSMALGVRQRPPVRPGSALAGSTCPSPKPVTGNGNVNFAFTPESTQL